MSDTTLPARPFALPRSRTGRFVLVAAGWLALVSAGAAVYARPAPPAADDAEPASDAGELARWHAACPTAAGHTGGAVRVQVRPDRCDPVPGLCLRVEQAVVGGVVAFRIPWADRERVRVGEPVVVRAVVVAADAGRLDLGFAIPE